MFLQLFIEGNFVGGSEIILGMHQASSLFILFCLCTKPIILTRAWFFLHKFLQKGEDLLGDMAQRGGQKADANEP